MTNFKLKLTPAAVEAAYCSQMALHSGTIRKVLEAALPHIEIVDLEAPASGNRLDVVISEVLASYKQWKSDRLIGDAADPDRYLEMVMEELSALNRHIVAPTQ